MRIEEYLFCILLQTIPCAAACFRALAQRSDDSIRHAAVLSFLYYTK